MFWSFRFQLPSRDSQTLREIAHQPVAMLDLAGLGVGTERASRGLTGDYPADRTRFLWVMGPLGRRWRTGLGICNGFQYLPDGSGFAARGAYGATQG